MRLRHLEADRAAADDDEMIGAPRQVEDRLIGEIRHRRKTGDRRDCGRGAGRDDEAAGADCRSTGGERARPGEAAGGMNDVYAKPFVPRHRIHRRDGRDDVVDMALDRGEIDLGLADRDAEAPGGATSLGRLRGGEQRLRGDAAEIEAVAAHLVVLEQHRHDPEPRGAGRHQQPGEPAPMTQMSQSIVSIILAAWAAFFC